MNKKNLFLSIPLGAGLLLAGCGDTETDEPVGEEIEELEDEIGEEGTFEPDAEEPDLDEEPSEDPGGNLGSDEDEPDLDEEPSEDPQDTEGGDEVEPDVDEEPSED
jgi:hypothetical protein